MTIFQTLQRVRQAAQQPLPYREEYERLAADAYVACCEWFGAPPDAKHPFYLFVSPDNMSGCGYFLGQYSISLTPSLDTPELRCENIGHEMYHRVTSRRPGLRREPWIDEVMAFLASEWFLRRHGYHDYVRQNRRHHVIRKNRVDISALRLFRRPRPLVATRSRDDYYPEDFYPDVQRIAIALNYVVSTTDLTRLPWANSLPSWVDSLPDDRRACVRRLLELDGQNHQDSCSEELHVRMGQAFQVVGRFDEAVVEYRLAQDKGASQETLFFEIALCLERGDHLDEAREAYLLAAQQNPQDEWTAYNLALLFKEQKDYPAAIEWFQQTLQLRPDWPQALYYLGGTLAQDGQVEKARQCWERIIGLSDGTYSASARGSLDAWKDVELAENATADLGISEAANEE